MKKKYSLRFQLLIYMLLFVVAILGFIYLFQTTFLDTFYIRNKISTLQSVANSIEQYIGDDDMQSIIEQASMSNEVCIRVISNNNDYNFTGACTLRNIDNNTINLIASETLNNNNEKLFDNFRYQAPFGPHRPENIYIYSKLIDINNEKVMILTSSGITPLNVTISTIKSQYLVIVAVVVIMPIILALIISRFILKPIKQINEESKNLSKGNYDGYNINTNSLEYAELNETLKIANEDILKADKAEKELLGNISHDLRTPLTMIVGYGEMIRDLPEENNAENINVIIDEAKRLSSLVDDLVDISKAEFGQIELNESDIDLNDLLQSVYHQYEKYCESKNIELRLNIEENISFKADEKRIKQVLYNFINNSLNYNNKDNQVIEIGSEKIDNYCRVYVYDNGEGIEQKDINNIWDRYYKVDKEHKRHQLGSGIGLSLSRQLLKAHGFNYGVESKYGEYSKFYFDVRDSK